MSLVDAKSKAAHLRAGIKEGIDPIAERKRSNNAEYKTVNDIAKDWLQECAKRLENPQIPERVYRKDIAPSIGELAITRVPPVDIQSIIRKIKDSNRPTISNDALIYCGNPPIFNCRSYAALSGGLPSLALYGRS